MLFVPLWKCFIWYHFPSNLRASFSISCSEGLPVMISFRFYISENHFILLSFLKSISAEYRILGWQVFFFKNVALLYSQLPWFQRNLKSSLPIFQCFKWLFSLSTFKIFCLLTSLEKFNYAGSWCHFLNASCAWF